jgi:CRISPR/Cas system CSM-associated protein Csm4 (group 5 of RAMP superfamily)
MARDTYNTGDSRFAVVEWIGENKFNPIPMSDFVKLNNNEDYRDGEIYKVRFFGKKYQAKLIQKGTAEECEKRVEYLTNYLLEQGKKKQASKSTNKQNEKEVEKQNETLTMELKDMEITKLKENLARMTESYNLEKQNGHDLSKKVEALEKQRELEMDILGIQFFFNLTLTCP